MRVPPENDWRSETRICHLRIVCVCVELIVFWETEIMRASRGFFLFLIHKLKICKSVYLQLAVLCIKGPPRQCLQDHLYLIQFSLLFQFLGDLSPVL